MADEMPPTKARTFCINFVGDVMLGRLIDQLFPQHVHNPEEAKIVSQIRRRNPDLQEYTARHPWGSTLPLFQSADLNLVNLETSVTTVSEAWPDKMFNYRMHPANIASLHEAHIDYASLANNHTLDFGTEGLSETVQTLTRERIGFAGAGETSDQARSACILSLPRNPRGVYHGGQLEDPASVTVSPAEENDHQKKHAVHVYSASDHPSDWSIVPTFHLIDYSTSTKEHLRSLLTKPQSKTQREPETNLAPPPPPSLSIFSVHWGPNYRWRPAREIRSLAHFLIDECGVDIVHGHSSHHVQGVERYGSGVIIYGCGDFVDDYALDREFRNDLGALWRVSVCEREQCPKKNEGSEGSSNSGPGSGSERPAKGQKRLYLDKLEIFPTRIHQFQAQFLERADPDHQWVRDKITALSKEFGTNVRSDLGERGQMVIDLV